MCKGKQARLFFKKTNEDESETYARALEHVVPLEPTVEQIKSTLIGGTRNYETDSSTKVCGCWITLFLVFINQTTVDGF